MFKKIGPGFLVAAAFIGPGTVTTCTLAGVGFGHALLWTVLLSVLATIILQEMAARLGIVTQTGLADIIKQGLRPKWLRVLVLAIILAAILVGNAAYEGGNIGGATLGLEALFGDKGIGLYPFVVGFAVFILLWIGNYKVLEKVFLALIILMSLSFIVTAILTKPNLGELFKGLFLPSFPKDSLFTVIALVGTTIVPYNLFLHASLVNEKWKSTNELKIARWDTILSIALGGLVSMCIVIAATAIPSDTVTGAMDLALGLQPLYGNAARYFMGIGLFAAGITSSITAPLAAAYVANSCFGWKAGLKDYRFRWVWMVILALGVLSLSTGVKPIQIIQFAQIANGMLLPIIAFLLVWITGRASILGKFSNGTWQKVLGYGVVALAFLLGLKSIIKVLGYL